MWEGLGQVEPYQEGDSELKKKKQANHREQASEQQFLQGLFQFLRWVPSLTSLQEEQD